MVLSCFCQDLSCLFDRFHHVAWGHNFSRVWKTNWRVKRIDICCEFEKTLTQKLANVRRQVFKKLTWWNVTVDWSWRRKFYESDVIWKGVRVPQRVSPSVVGTDFNPGNINVSSECREVKQKTSLGTCWAHLRPWYCELQAWCRSRKRRQHSVPRSARRSPISMNLHRTWTGQSGWQQKWKAAHN